jgi:hypothetical protein
MRTSCLSREAETCCVRRRLVVRGGDSSGGLPLVGNLSEKLPTSREPDILPMMVLIGVFSPPRLEAFTLSMVSEDSTSRAIISPSKRALIWALVTWSIV